MSAAQISETLYRAAPLQARHRTRGMTERLSRARIRQAVSIALGLVALALFLGVLAAQAGGPSPVPVRAQDEFATPPHDRLEISPPPERLLIDVMPVP